MKIAIDIDGVLARFTPEGIRPTVEKLWPGRMPPGYVPSDWFHSDILEKKDWSTIWGEIDQIENFWEGLEPYTESFKALDEFQVRNGDQDIEIYLVTARQRVKGRPTIEQTVRWLVKQKTEYGMQHADNVSVITTAENKSGSKCKAEIYNAIGIEMSIDDRYDNVWEAFSVEKHTPYLLNRKWNQKSPTQIDAYRVNTLGEFLDKVEGRLKKS